MFRKMRKEKRQLNTEEISEILNRADYGVLSTVGADSYPYAVPVNYVYHQQKIYFHCATTGHKIENIKHNANVSFCVVGEAKIQSEKFTTGFNSVILFGQAKEVFTAEKEEALIAILERFSPEHMVKGKKQIKAAWEQTKVIEITVEHISGKGSK